MRTETTKRPCNVKMPEVHMSCSQGRASKHVRRAQIPANRGKAGRVSSFGGSTGCRRQRFVDTRCCAEGKCCSKQCDIFKESRQLLSLFPLQHSSSEPNHPTSQSNQRAVEAKVSTSFRYLFLPPFHRNLQGLKFVLVVLPSCSCNDSRGLQDRTTNILKSWISTQK